MYYTLITDRDVVAYNAPGCRRRNHTQIALGLQQSCFYPSKGIDHPLLLFSAI